MTKYPWEDWIVKWLKVPPPPVPPAGSKGSTRIFRAAAGFYKYRLIGWGMKQASALVGIVVGLTFFEAIPDINILGFAVVSLGDIIEIFAILAFIAQLPFTFALVHLDYRMRWYIVTDRSLRIREGIWRVKEQTMTFSNIQNMAIQQGPLQRFFEIEDLRVRTAGGGEAVDHENAEKAGMNMHLGYFHGVDNAALIRDAILEHLKRLKSGGLGDPEEAETEAAPEPAAGVPPGAPALLDAAREALREARLLRSATTPRSPLP